MDYIHPVLLRLCVSGGENVDPTSRLSLRCSVAIRREGEGDCLAIIRLPLCRGDMLKMHQSYIINTLCGCVENTKHGGSI